MAGKATELASYYVSISANTKGLAKDITSQVTKDMDGALGTVEKQAAKRSSGIGKKLASGLGKTLKVGAAAAGVAVGGTLAKAISGGFGRLKSIEQAEAQLKGLGHSGTEVAAIMKDANEAVKGTAFSMGDAASVAAQMTAAGIQPGKELTRILSLVGDTAANTGEDLSSIGAIWGKVAAKGKLDGETLAQIQERGIGLTSALAEEYGVTAEEATKMVSQGKVDFEDFARVMENTLGGSALIAGSTFSGALANVNAALGRLGAALIGPVFASGPAIFGNLNTAIDNVTGAVEPLAAKFGEWLAPQLERLSEKAVELSEKLPGIIDGFQNGDTEGAAGVLRSLADGAQNLAAAAAAAGPALAQIGASSFGVSLQLMAATLEAMAPLLQGVVIPALAGLSGFLAENEWAAKLLGAALVGAFVVPKVTSGISAISGSLKAMSGTISKTKSSWTTFTTLMGNGEGLTKGQAATNALSENFPKMSKGVGAASKAMTALKASMMAHPIMWIAAAIAAVVAALVWFFTKTETGKAIWESFSAKVKEVWEVHLQPIFTALKEKAAEVFGWMVDVLWPKVMGIWGALGEVVTWLWNNVLSPIWTIIKYTWTALVLAMFAAWEFILKPAWNAIAAVMQWLWNTILLPIWNALKLAWSGLMMAMKFVWESILKPAWDAIKNAMLALWNNHLRPAWDAMKSKWDEVISIIKNIWETKLRPAWEAMKQKIQEVVDTYIRPALNRMKEAFQGARDKVSAVVEGIKTVWNKLRSILAKPINFLIRSVWNHGILKVWRKAKTFLPVAEPPGDMATIPEFATGGAIYGPGTGTSDSIIARLSHGEHVLTAKEVKALGGHSAVEQLRAMARAGSLTPCIIRQVAQNINSASDGRRGDIGGLLAFAKGGPVIMDRSAMKVEEPAWMAKVDKGHAWAKSRSGRPYVWGGSAHGSTGTDCSGFMSGIADVILGGNGARQWATGAFNTSAGSQNVAGQQWTAGLGPGFSIFVWNGGPYGGHTGGTLGKTNKNPAVNVESGGSPSLVKYGAGAAGADHPQAAQGGQFHLAIGADGDFVSGGSGGPSPEEMIAKIKEKIKDLLDSVMQPIKDNIRAIVGDPTTVIKDIPHQALDMLPTKLLDQLFKVAENLDDLLSTVYNKAKDLVSWAVPSFLRDSGGPLPTGTSIVQNNTGQREFVLTMEQFKIAQGVLRGIGRADLADDLGERAGVKSDDKDKNIAAELAESTTSFFANDFATFIGLGGKDNIFTNPSKSFAGTVIDMMLRPHAYQKDAKTTDAMGGSDDEVSAAATAEAVEAAPAQPSGSSSSGIDEDAARVADYEQGEEGYESSVHMPDLIEDGDPGGEGVERFRKLVKQLLDHYGHPASWVENTLRRMNQESGGDVNAVNKWDVNWQNGVPSVGLMQVTKPAYSDHKDPKFDKGPYEYGVSKNPAANIASSMRYTMKRYGSLPAGYDRAGGYRYGGWVRGAGTGTSDSIVARLSNGEFVVNARDAAHNAHLLEAMNSGQLRGSAVTRPVEAITPAAATNAAGGPLVSVGTIQARDEQSAIDKLQRFAHRASRSAALHGGR